jgi:hypothetical protein
MNRIKVFLAALLLSASLHATEPMVSIGNVPSGDNITRQEVVWFYTLKYKTWPDGSLVKIVLLSDDSPDHAEFVRNVLGLTVNQYRRQLDLSINSGAGVNLIRVRTPAEMIKIVETTPYSLGYISKDYLILRGADKNVKVLRIVD